MDLECANIFAQSTVGPTKGLVASALSRGTAGSGSRTELNPPRRLTLSMPLESFVEIAGRLIEALYGW